MFTLIVQKFWRRAHGFVRLLDFVFLLALAGCVHSYPTKPIAVIPPDSVTVTPTGEAAKIAPPAEPAPAAEFVSREWRSLFDGKTLAGWRETPFAGHGGAQVENGNLLMGAGSALSGVNYTNALPKINYEFALEAKRVEGSDFFCGITFPVGDTFASFIVGGWGCCLVGVSSVNGEDASQNETSSTMAFEKGRWYRIRLRVTTAKIEAWIDDKQVVDLETTDKKIALRYGEIELSKPFGLATWVTTAAWRDLRLRTVDPKAGVNGK